MTTELVLRYPAASTASDTTVELSAATPEGERAFFDGYAQQPAQAAQAMLCVARVARTRFYEPPGMVAARLAAADPVVTAEPDRLRFESFSACCGVHARFDLLPDGLEVRSCRPGTTNVDFNPPMREALAKIAHRDPLRIKVGADTVEVQTLDGTVIERRVPLPERWVKGFGEVQVALTGLAPLVQLGSVETQRFIRSLPRGRAGDMALWAEPTAGTLRLGRVFRPSAVCVAAPARLRVLEPLARFASSLTAYSDPDATGPSPVAWVLAISGGRVCLTLSPERNRGFSGEGGLLMDLVSHQAALDALALLDATHQLERFSPEQATTASNLTHARSRAALTWLGVHGRIGFDPPDNAYFWRRLPYPDAVLQSDPPRLRDARALVAADAVRPAGDSTAVVRSEDREYRTTLADGRYDCTCPWISKHGTTRGPCKHVLASALAGARQPSAQGPALGGM